MKSKLTADVPAWTDLVGTMRQDVRRFADTLTGPFDRFGWQVETSHVPGSFRMLAIWVASYTIGLGVSHTTGQHLAAVGLIMTGLVVGAKVLLRVDAPNREPMRASDNPYAEDPAETVAPPAVAELEEHPLLTEPVNLGREEAA